MGTRQFSVLLESGVTVTSTTFNGMFHELAEPVVTDRTGMYGIIVDLATGEPTELVWLGPAGEPK